MLVTRGQEMDKYIHIDQDSISISGTFTEYEVESLIRAIEGLKKAQTQRQKLTRYIALLPLVYLLAFTLTLITVSVTSPTTYTGQRHEQSYPVHHE